MTRISSPKSASQAAGSGLTPPLTALSGELSAAQELVLDLQISVSEVLQRAGGGSGADCCDAIYELQALDRLAQTLGDLATFSRALAGASPESWAGDAPDIAALLKLRDLAHRLCGGEAVPAGSLAGGDDEDCVFF